MWIYMKQSQSIF